MDKSTSAIHIPDVKYSTLTTSNPLLEPFGIQFESPVVYKGLALFVGPTSISYNVILPGEKTSLCFDEVDHSSHPSYVDRFRTGLRIFPFSAAIQMKGNLFRPFFTYKYPYFEICCIYSWVVFKQLVIYF